MADISLMLADAHISEPSLGSITGCVSIDIGYKHMVVCQIVQHGNRRQFAEDVVRGEPNLYLFSIDSTLSMKLRIQQLHDRLTFVFSKLSTPIPTIIIEKQLPDTPNFGLEYAICMYITSNFPSIQYVLQNANTKYKRFDGMKKNMKIHGSQFIQDHFINKDKVHIVSNQEFGGQTTTQIKPTNWHSQKSIQLMTQNGIDKLDDISDTILILLAWSDFLQQQK